MDLFGAAKKREEVKPPEVEEETMTNLEILQKEKELLGFYVTGHPLDEFREKIKEFKCTSLDELHNLPDKSVVKVACILETIQVRISAKSQKKFAITKIGDGGEQFEMPVWPELFEAKGKVLDDNALLVAVIQIDKKEEPLKLNCKWIENLSNSDEKLASEFESAYQDAKKSSAKFEKREAKMEKEEKKPIKLVIDINKISMRKVLELKRLFAESPGGHAVDISFQSDEREIATLAVDAGRGVAVTPEFEARLSGLTYIVKKGYDV